eukprot:TRINITY_DN5155_c0_g1_i6.p2 TRINITY_DN5155_c0_g1~~TRINITY_DN5155_c0_g1_i6.p2  ORF type:complete len:165 (-),score=25.31 TRINITY_DN5155_c0_g1_i6:146-640(-)
MISCTLKHSIRTSPLHWSCLSVSQSTMPFSRIKWDTWEDSEDEIEEDWILTEEEDLRDEFKDVTHKDKEFMSLWNLFVSSHNLAKLSMIRPDGLVVNFVSQHGKQIRDQKLEAQLFHHMLQMWEVCLLSPSKMEEIRSWYLERGHPNKHQVQQPAKKQCIRVGE